MRQLPVDPLQEPGFEPPNHRSHPPIEGYLKIGLPNKRKSRNSASEAPVLIFWTRLFQELGLWEMRDQSQMMIGLEWGWGKLQKLQFVMKIGVNYKSST